ncbi:hypothetical protein FRC03_010142 [Tulasnella sp. 419]|nr:hypothetical protein FRC03_010142 [Tulasnella sp. 419]
MKAIGILSILLGFMTLQVFAAPVKDHHGYDDNIHITEPNVLPSSEQDPTQGGWVKDEGWHSYPDEERDDRVPDDSAEKSSDDRTALERYEEFSRITGPFHSY